MDSLENNEVVNHFKACRTQIICIIFSFIQRSMLDAPLIAHLLIQSDWNFQGTLGPPGTCCFPSATTAAATSAPYAPLSTTPAAPTTRGPPRAGGGRSCTLGSCTFAGEDLLLGTTLILSLPQNFCLFLQNEEFLFSPSMLQKKVVILYFQDGHCGI